MHVYGNSAVHNRIESTNGAVSLELRHTNKYGQVNWYYQGAHKWQLGQINQENDISFYQPTGVASGENAYRFTVKNSGRIGIGTHNPASNFNIHYPSK